MIDVNQTITRDRSAPPARTKCATPLARLSRDYPRILAARGVKMLNGKPIEWFIGEPETDDLKPDIDESPQGDSQEIPKQGGVTFSDPDGCKPGPRAQGDEILLPGPCGIDKFCEAFFSKLRELVFSRGWEPVVLRIRGDEACFASLDAYTVKAFLSRFFTPITFIKVKDTRVKKIGKLSVEDAKTVIAYVRSIGSELLNPISTIHRSPLITEEGGSASVLGHGYHRGLGGIYVTCRKLPPEMTLDEAVEKLKWIIDEFDFASESDRTRALASFITPALRFGGLLTDKIPMEIAEAVGPEETRSQSGKGYLHKLVRAVYNAQGTYNPGQEGGVGSFDEAFASAVHAGNPFVIIDNFRGSLFSRTIEIFITVSKGDTMKLRIPHVGYIEVDTQPFIIQLTNNGMEVSRDLANRVSVVRIKKRPGFKYRDTLGAIEANWQTYLGAVFRIVREWIERGQPRIDERRHDFTTWGGSLGWICKHLLNCEADLCDEVEEIREKLVEPTKDWFTELCEAITRGEIGASLPSSATELRDQCDMENIALPWKSEDAAMQIGKALGRMFGDRDRITIGQYRIDRSKVDYGKPSGDKGQKNVYAFARLGSASAAPVVPESDSEMCAAPQSQGSKFSLAAGKNPFHDNRKLSL